MIMMVMGLAPKILVHRGRSKKGVRPPSRPKPRVVPPMPIPHTVYEKGPGIAYSGRTPPNPYQTTPSSIQGVCVRMLVVYY